MGARTLSEGAVQEKNKGKKKEKTNSDSQRQRGAGTGWCWRPSQIDDSEGQKEKEKEIQKESVSSFHHDIVIILTYYSSDNYQLILSKIDILKNLENIWVTHEFIHYVYSNFHN